MIVKLAKIIDGGKILSSYSFGTAEISTGQKTGPVTISTSVNGVGTGSFTTNIINTLETKKKCDCFHLLGRIV